MRLVSSIAPSAVTVSAYCGLLVLLAIPLVLPLVPGTVEFFVAHALGWGLATVLLILQRKRAWESAGISDGPPWRPDWTEPFPAWAFEGALLLHLVDVPVAVRMAVKILSSRDALGRALSLTLDQMPGDVRYGPPLALEHWVFASHFGIFLGDLAVYWSKPDRMFFAHHVCSMVLLGCGSLVGVVPGIVALAFCTGVLEIGSMSYCAWVVWRSKRTYISLMTLSNGVYFATLLAILYHAREFTFFFSGLMIVGIGLIIGRTAVLFRDVSLRPKVA
jgi:hypothetical protein